MLHFLVLNSKSSAILHITKVGVVMGKCWRRPEPYFSTLEWLEVKRWIRRNVIEIFGLFRCGHCHLPIVGGGWHLHHLNYTYRYREHADYYNGARETLMPVHSGCHDEIHCSGRSLRDLDRKFGASKPSSKVFHSEVLARDLQEILDGRPWRL